MEYKKEFSDYINEIGEVLEEFGGPLSGILNYEEMLDSGERLLSKKFFQENNRVNKEKINQKDIDNAYIFFSQMLEKIKRLKEEVQNDPDIKESQRKFLINKLNNSGLKAIYLKKAIYIEGEKGGYELDDYDKVLYLSQISRLQDALYGSKVSENPDEIQMTSSYLDNLFQNNQEVLSKEDKKYFESFLNEISINSQLENEKTEVEDNQNNQSETTDEQSFLDTQIPISQVKDILEKILEIGKIDDLLGVEISESNTNFSVNASKKKIIIPAKQEEISVKRILELIDHEVFTHGLRLYNKQNTVEANSPSYLEIEEGIAVLNEKLSNSELNTIDLSPTIHHISTLIGENYDFQQTYNLLRIYYLLEGNSEEKSDNLSYNRALRVKRFYSFDKPGANRKDVSYFRGLKDVFSKVTLQQEGFESSEDFEQFLRDFYFARFDENDMSLIPELKEDLNIDENSIKYPIFVGRLLQQMLYKLQSGEGFYMQESQVDDIDKLHEGDPRPTLENITMSQKRKIAEVLGMLDQEI